MTTEQLPQDVDIIPIRAFSDNYIWCIQNATHAVVVDPGDAEPVLAHLKSHSLDLAAILITHHHPDHTGGITRLSSTKPNIPVIGPRGGHIRGITKSVAQGDCIRLPVLSIVLSVMEVPGHTLDHIAFFGHNVLFCGDTLFSAGCGRLFEGSASQMLRSLTKLKRLPPQTNVYCTHEYTQANIRFAQAVEPQNIALGEYAAWVDQQRQADGCTLPSTIEQEKRINPFLRTDCDSVAAAVRSQTDDKLSDETAVFAALRAWKDHF